MLKLLRAWRKNKKQPTAEKIQRAQKRTGQKVPVNLQDLDPSYRVLLQELSKR